MTVKLLYFKLNGKYYCEGQYITKLAQMFEIWEEVEHLQDVGTLPGMLRGVWEGPISVDVPEHPNNHPRLLNL